jgi:hypothetical protein
MEPNPATDVSHPRLGSLPSNQRGSSTRKPNLSAIFNISKSFPGLWIPGDRERGSWIGHSNNMYPLAFITSCDRMSPIIIIIITVQIIRLRLPGFGSQNGLAGNNSDPARQISLTAV